jgi:DegV family protein with EDD domain
LRKVAVVTDSTAYLPADLVKDLPIFIVPLHLIIGKTSYADGVDIQPDEFYTLQQESKIVPTTSQPSPEEFIDQFKKLLKSGYDIICIVISSGISGTYHSACQARETLKGENIEVIDSHLTSMGMGYPIIKVAQAANQGADLQECKELAGRLLQNAGAIFTVTTLKFLYLGGRINTAAAFMGTLLDMKPLLELKDGKIEAMGRVRTFSKALDKLADIFIERTRNHQEIHIGYLLAKTYEKAQILNQKIVSRIDKPERIVRTVYVDISPVIGAHTGPGTLGLAYFFGI